MAFSPAGERVARDLAAGLARPFPFRSLLLRDGADMARVRAAITAGLGEGVLLDQPRTGMGAEDFAYFVQPETGVKGVYFSVGGTPEADVMKVHRLTDRRVLLEVPCGMGAYNFSSLLFMANDRPPYQPKPLDDVDGEFDAETGTVHSSMKGRGIGDCWRVREWRFDGQGSAHRTQVWVAAGVGVTPFLALLEARQKESAASAPAHHVTHGREHVAEDVGANHRLAIDHAQVLTADDAFGCGGGQEKVFVALGKPAHVNPL